MQKYTAMWKDLKYLLAYTAPLALALGLAWGGAWSWAAVILTFGIIPALELVLPASTANVPPEEEPIRARRRFFDLLLYVHVPLLYTLVLWYFHVLTHEPLSTSELLGLTLGTGIMVGSFGINVGHELGHRPEWYHQAFAKMLLVPALYAHFTIEHNRGHHKWVATPLDPSTARRGEPIYRFWLRSIAGVWRNAWQLERRRLEAKGLPFFSLHNDMIVNLLAEAAWIALAVFLFGWAVVPALLVIALIGVLLLESVNYIEHYGLLRRELAPGRYERVLPRHSWNSDHELGRIFLYELTRHSDHHYKASRKYQILRHMDDSPQLPFGYPMSILIALIPPLWFRLMDHRVESLGLQAAA